MNSCIIDISDATIQQAKDIAEMIVDIEIQPEGCLSYKGFDLFYFDDFIYALREQLDYNQEEALRLVSEIKRACRSKILLIFSPSMSSVLSNQMTCYRVTAAWSFNRAEHIL